MNFKTIWITGASSGLGETLALRYAKPGVDLILSSIDEDKLAIVAQKCKQAGAQVYQIVFDVSQAQEIERASTIVLDKYQSIDLLINNAGIGQRSLASETSANVEQKIMDTNFWSAVNLSKAILPSMKSRNIGHIVVISSISGLFSFPNRSMYAASKHALLGYFEALSLELSKTGICICLICPGRLKNDFSLQALTAKGEKYNKMDASHVNGVPLELACRKIARAIEKRKRYLVFGKKELTLWYIKRISLSLFFKVASKISILK